MAAACPGVASNVQVPRSVEDVRHLLFAFAAARDLLCDLCVMRPGFDPLAPTIPSDRL
jgi:hypothetical protein